MKYSFQQFKKNFTIRNEKGMDIVRLEPIRPSIQAYEELKVLGAKIAELMTENESLREAVSADR